MGSRRSRNWTQFGPTEAALASNGNARSRITRDVPCLNRMAGRVLTEAFCLPAGAAWKAVVASREPHSSNCNRDPQGPISSRRSHARYSSLAMQEPLLTRFGGDRQVNCQANRPVVLR
jgi:hypothetical protein